MLRITMERPSARSGMQGDRYCNKLTKKVTITAE